MQGANLEQRAVDPGFPLDGHANVLHAPPDFIDLLPVAAYACDAPGRILWFNRRAAELWGRKPRIGDDGERFCGSWKLYFGGRQVSHAEAPMAVVLRTGEAIHGEEGCLEHPDGSRIWATVHIDPVKDAKGPTRSGTSAKSSRRRRTRSSTWSTTCWMWRGSPAATSSSTGIRCASPR